jgi:Aspartyl protease
MQFILDTGGQNILTPDALRALGLHAVGGARVGGAGAGQLGLKWTTVSSVRVGAAQMRNQPFLVIDFGKLLKGIDGILGYELLARFPARIDYRSETLQLAGSLPTDWIADARGAPFTFRERQPQTAGAIDGLPAQLTIDTGSNGTLDINTPFAVAHDLWKRYNARAPKLAYAGAGGGVKASQVQIKTVRVGAVTRTGVDATLAQATAGFESDPSFAANVGEGIFRSSTLILDYPHRRLYFAPGGLHDRAGLSLSAKDGSIVVDSVHPGSPAASGILAGMRLTSIDGKAVNASDLTMVEQTLSERPGTRHALVFNGNLHRSLILRNYL